MYVLLACLYVYISLLLFAIRVDIEGGGTRSSEWDIYNICLSSVFLFCYILNTQLYLSFNIMIKLKKDQVQSGE